MKQTPLGVLKAPSSLGLLNVAPPEHFGRTYAGVRSTLLRNLLIILADPTSTMLLSAKLDCLMKTHRAVHLPEKSQALSIHTVDQSELTARNAVGPSGGFEH